VASRVMFSERCWDSNDVDLIKGLAFLGEDSETFKRAPPVCQAKALKLLKNGWRPFAAVNSDALSKPLSPNEVDLTW